MTGERQTRCVLCKQETDPLHSGRTENDGHPAYVQRCRSCGPFIIEAPAVTILDGAVADGVRTRTDILEHFRRVIAENDDGAIITTDAAQDYCYATDLVDGKIAALGHLLLRHLHLTSTEQEIATLQALLEKDLSDLSKIEPMPGFSSRKLDGMQAVVALFCQRLEAASTSQATQTEAPTDPSEPRQPPKSWTQRIRDIVSAGLVVDKIRDFVDWWSGS